MGDEKTPSTARRTGRLTKSLFKRALECPTKLFYAMHPEYADSQIDDPFLLALADGGFQVGALAQCYSSGGVEIAERDPVRALALTQAHLQQPNAILFEAAFEYGPCFIRADIVEKQSDTLRIFEVKAKSTSVDAAVRNARLEKKGIIQINADWKPYLFDLAFQTYVIRKQYPHLRVVPYLLLADKDTTASVDGLAQRFRVRRDPNQRASVERVGDASTDALGTPVLTPKLFEEEVNAILNSRQFGVRAGLEGGEPGFEELTLALASVLHSPSHPRTELSAACKTCEFNTRENPLLLDGRKECWKKEFERRPQGHPVYTLWFAPTAKLIQDGVYFLEDMKESDFSSSKRGERQRLQWRKTVTQDGTMELDRASLAQAMGKLTYPLHFIDFETLTPALPFAKGNRPYETLAFQFSHHILEADGTLRHADEYLSRERGSFPNFDFIRALKKSLQADCGSILRYAAHENNVLNAIARQLDGPLGKDVADRQELSTWIRTITQSANHSGPRAMVDLLEWVKAFYYLPEMEGSNSLKVVLPTTLARSRFLQAKYSRPIYGTSQIPSHNFKDKTWLREIDGKWQNPYEQLPRIFENYSLDQLDSLKEEDQGIADGGAAMMAYAAMQYADLSQTEFETFAAQLLRYCELDTLAMVMLFEAWQDWLHSD